jgi:hypothetical protein
VYKRKRVSVPPTSKKGTSAKSFSREKYATSTTESRPSAWHSACMVRASEAATSSWWPQSRGYIPIISINFNQLHLLLLFSTREPRQIEVFNAWLCFSFRWV